MGHEFEHRASFKFGRRVLFLSFLLGSAEMLLAQTVTPRLDAQNRILPNYSDPLIDEYFSTPQTRFLATDEVPAQVAKSRTPIAIFDWQAAPRATSRTLAPISPSQLPSEAKRQSAEDAMRSILVDEEDGLWYSIEYNDIDPNLEVSQFCSRRPPEIVPETAPGMRDAPSAAKQVPVARIARDFEDGHNDYSVEMDFFIANVPCTLIVRCLKRSDARCANEAFIRSLGNPSQLKAVYVPAAD